MIRSSRTCHGSATWAAIASTSSSSVATACTGSPSTGSPGTGAGGRAPAEVQRAPDRVRQGGDPCVGVGALAGARHGALASSSPARCALGEQRLRARPLRRREHVQRSAQRARADSSNPQCSSRVSASPWMSAAWCVSAIVAAMGGPPARSSNFRAARTVFFAGAASAGPRSSPRGGGSIRPSSSTREADNRRGPGAQQRREGVRPRRALGVTSPRARARASCTSSSR